MLSLDWSNPYPSTRHPVFGRNVVATSHPLAAQAGLSILQRGGNAVDAAIATAAVMTIVEPCSNGLGSDLFALVWDGERLHGLNASGHAPGLWTSAWFRSRHGADAVKTPLRGWDAVTVPGAVGGWSALSERFGALPFEELMAPAIDVATRGSAVPVVVQQKWALAAQVEDLVRQPGFAAAFLPNGRAPAVGERFVLEGAKRTLELVAKTKGRAYYEGEIAAGIAAWARETGGAMTEADLAAYAPEWVEPIARDYGGCTLHEIPPNGQGIAALMALGILEHLGVGAERVDSVAAQHLQIEAMKLAFADVYAHVGDARTMHLTAADLLDDAYLAERARLVDRTKAQAFSTGKPPAGGTIYLTAADDKGCMVSLIQSNYMGFGSGVVVPGFGISLQNRGHGFSLDPASPNAVQPGRRPFHTIIPAFLTRGGESLMSFGVMGGNMQPQGHLQMVVRMLDHGQSPQVACDAPRWRFDSGLKLDVESRMDPAVVEGLRGLGHRIEPFRDSYQDFGAGQFILRLGDPAVEGYAAASDPRRDGQVAAC
jgi:gamma-glutamyltranspeptidase/glutathione hydrolase